MDPLGLGAGELARAIKAGDLDAIDVVDAHIGRIESVNGKLNAVITPMFDSAR